MHKSTITDHRRHANIAASRQQCSHVQPRVATWHNWAPLFAAMPRDDRSRSPRAWTPTSDDARYHGSEVLKLLIELYASCKVTARELSVLCWHLEKAGTPGAAFALYASSPHLQSGKYQQNLDKVLPKCGPFYYMKTPGNWNGQSHRSVMEIPLRPAFDSIDSELNDDPDILKQLDGPDDNRPRNALDTPAYNNHPLV
eukprot:1042302-Pyramimonas_sp.AAC.1